MSDAKAGRAWHAENAEGSIRITIRDALTLQGFNPDRPLVGTKTAQFRQVGNAVPPPVACAVARALLDTVEAERAA